MDDDLLRFASQVRRPRPDADHDPAARCRHLYIKTDSVSGVLIENTPPPAAVTEEDLAGLRKKAKNLLNARASQKVDSSRSG